jgi:hypothetical protein
MTADRSDRTASLSLLCLRLTRHKIEILSLLCNEKVTWLGSRPALLSKQVSWPLSFWQPCSLWGARRLSPPGSCARKSPSAVPPRCFWPTPSVSLPPAPPFPCHRQQMLTAARAHKLQGGMRWYVGVSVPPEMWGGTGCKFVNSRMCPSAR